MRQRPMGEIVIFVSSLPKLRAEGIAFVFTYRHASLATAQFSSDLKTLGRIDWALLRSRNFKRDPEDPGKLERYQAEALVHRSLPMQAILGVVCNNDVMQAAVQQQATSYGHALQVVSRPGWYV